MVEDNKFWMAFAWGGLSAISCVIGAAIGIKYQFRNSVRAQLMAFGAGALLFATTNELFAKTIEQYVLFFNHPDMFRSEGGLTGCLLLILFGFIGALTFVLLSNLLDSRGGFERKRATLKKFLHKYMKAQAKGKTPQAMKGVTQQRLDGLDNMMAREDKSSFLPNPPPHHHHHHRHHEKHRDKSLLSAAEIAALPAIDLSDIRFSSGGKSTENIGSVDAAAAVTSSAADVVTSAVENDIEAGVTSNNSADDGNDGVGSSSSSYLKHEKSEKKLNNNHDNNNNNNNNTNNTSNINSNNSSQDTVKRIAHGAVLDDSDALPNFSKIGINSNGSSSIMDSNMSKSTEMNSIGHSTRNSMDGDDSQVASAHLESSSSSTGLAVWLGLMIDGVPESLIIGTLSSQNKLTLAFLIGVSVSNFPEALSSADIMVKEGHSKLVVMSLWSALCLFTAVGAGIGALVVPDDAHLVERSLEGMGGGAMLAVILGTMMPEATDHGGLKVTLMAVLGYLCLVFLSLITARHGGPDLLP